MEKEERELRIRLTKLLADVQIQTAAIFGFGSLSVTLFVLGWQAYMVIIPEGFMIPQSVITLLAIAFFVAAPICLIAAVISLLRLRSTIEEMNSFR